MPWTPTPLTGTEYPVKLSFMRVSSGTADVRMHFSSPGKGRTLRYSGELLVSDAEVQLKPMRKLARNVEGVVGVSNDEVTLGLRARIESTPFEISGRVAGFKGSKLSLDVRSDRANLREISGLFGVKVPKDAVLPTSGRIHASISGPAKRPSALFRIDAPTLSYREYSGRNLHVEGMYLPQRVVIRSVEGEVYGGSARASGEFRWGDATSLSLHGSLSGLRLSQLPVLARREIASSTSGHFSVESEAGRTEATYRGTLTDGAIGEHTFSRGIAALSYGANGIHLDEVGAEVLGGRVVASGALTPDGGFDLEVSGAGINLAALQERYWSYPSVGTAQFKGKLRGTADRPIFDGQIEAYRVMVNGISAERIYADVEASEARLHLRKLEVEDPIGKLTASGDIAAPFSDAARLDLGVGIESLALEPLAISTGISVHVAGSLSADMTVTNTVSDPEVAGSMEITAGRIADLPIEYAEAGISYRDARLVLDDLEARSGSGVFRADGSIGLEDNAVSIAFSASDLPLSSLAGSLRNDVILAGSLNARGEMSGTIEETVVHAALASEAPSINGQVFDGFKADLTWKDDELQGTASLTDGKASYDLSKMTYSPFDEKVEVGFETRHALVERLLTLIQKGPPGGATARLGRQLGSVPRPCEGALDAEITGTIGLGGEKPAPDLLYRGTFSGVKVGPSNISTIRVEGGWQGEQITLNRLEALDGGTDLTASAALGPDGELHVQADVHGLDLATVGGWVKLDQNISGVADVTIIAEGTTKAPTVEASLDIQKPVIDDMRFDSLRARLSASPFSEGAPGWNRVNFDDLTVVMGDSQLSASGFIPVDWDKHTIPRDQPILVKVELNDDSLKLVSALAGENVQGKAGGTLAGTISYGGMIADPDMHGQLSWHDGRVHLSRLNEPFEHIEADLTFSGHTVLIDKFTAQSAQGGNLRLSGPIDVTTGDLDLNLATTNLRVSGENISRKYGETGEVVLKDGDIRITGNRKSPLIAGSVAIPEGSVGLASAEEAKPATRKRAFNPRFDLRVTVGRDLVFESARLRAALPGQLAIGGSLKEPVVDGLLDLADGTIVFPMRSFKILPGSDMRVRMAPGQPAVAIVDLQARARITDVSPLGRREKYTVTMQASGPLDKLRPTFTSSPIGLSEQRIMALVTGQYHFEQILKGSQGADIGRELSGLFSSAMMPRVFDPIEDAFRDVLGIDEFALEMGYEEPVQLSIGNRLGRNTYLSYSAALGSRPDYADNRYELRLSYRIRNNLELSVQTDEDSTIGIGAEGKIRF